MKITAEKREAGRFTFYNVNLHSAEGREPFLTIKDCKLMEGKSGQYVGFPSVQDRNNPEKWWKLVWGSDGFQAEIIKAMNAATVRQPDTRTLAERRPKPPVVDDEVPW